MPEIPLLCLLGPTASGKTALSYEILQEFRHRGIDCEIISADSRQVYRYLDIGSAKPTKEELDFTKHHCVDIINPNETISAGIFFEFAEKAIVEISQKKKIPIVVGGAGLYVKAIHDGLFAEIITNERATIREEIQSLLQKNGKEYLYEQLQTIDPKAAEYYSDKNPSRVSRALEYYYVHKTSIIDDFAKKKMQVNRLSTNYVLHPQREILYNRINQRTVTMFEKGLLEEVKNVLTMGYTRNDSGLQMIGYFEANQVLEGRVTQKDAIEIIQQRTRNYAKRQVTWFKKNPNLSLILEDSSNQSKTIVENYLREFEQFL
ncbi:MAG: tRNA (adenosine(37)-N6)-dimethylallyltransferase MiaA [Candidatus Kapabacteria bacterium]|nr:tRNA (adenosine(37)-N6)-dimethylallyltransferase MiaA [Candidatus Kapabacteria bacterium]